MENQIVSPNQGMLSRQAAKASKQVNIVNDPCTAEFGHIVASKAGGACDRLGRNSGLIDRMLGCL